VLTSKVVEDTLAQPQQPECREFENSAPFFGAVDTCPIAQEPRSGEDPRQKGEGNQGMGPTLIGLLQESVVKFASLSALKARNTDGSFLTVTYAELYAQVKELGTGLTAIGLPAGRHVALVTENSPKWLISDLAVLGCGAVDVPMSSRLSDREMEFILAHSDCETAIVENVDVFHRIATLRRRLPRLRRFILLDAAEGKPRGTGDSFRVQIHTWEEVRKKGKSRIERGDREFDLRAAAVQSKDPATILYTSGTTGRPKGVMLTHGGIMHNVTGIHAGISPAPGLTWLSVLPVWHSFERVVEYCSIHFGDTIAYSQPSEWKIFDDLRALRPNFLVMVPSLLEGIQKSMEKRLSAFQVVLVRFEKFSAVFSHFVAGLYPRFKKEERLLEIFAAILPLVLLSPMKVVSAIFLKRRVKTILGGNLRFIVCGGSPLPVYLDRFFAAIGVNLLEGYGLTETSGIVSVRSEKAPVLGSAGRPLPEVEIRIVGDEGGDLPPGEKGDILVKGPQLMRGYYKDPQGTRETLSPEGWLSTGDSGMLTIDGNLIVTGRRRHAVILRSGERVEPEPVETAVQESPYVQEAMAVGDRRESLGLLIVPHIDNLKRFASARRIRYFEDRELVENPAVRRLYEEEIQACLAGHGIALPAPLRFAVLPVQFEVGRELTRTMSKRRDVILRMYARNIEKLYRDKAGR
jgi:long-chain acyl-CoA synthetase